jgi:hypothetical protein
MAKRVSTLAAAKLLNVTDQTIRNYIHDGILTPAARKGRAPRAAARFDVEYLRSVALERGWDWDEEYAQQLQNK